MIYLKIISLLFLFYALEFYNTLKYMEHKMFIYLLRVYDLRTKNVVKNKFKIFFQTYTHIFEP